MIKRMSLYGQRTNNFSLAKRLHSFGIKIFSLGRLYVEVLGSHVNAVALQGLEGVPLVGVRDHDVPLELFFSLGSL